MMRYRWPHGIRKTETPGIDEGDPGETGKEEERGRKKSKHARRSETGGIADDGFGSFITSPLASLNIVEHVDTFLLFHV